MGKDFENALSEEDFVAILSKYRLGEYVSHKFLKVKVGTVRSCNYKLTTTKGNFVLKIENIKSKDLRIANSVINSLYNRGVLVQGIFKTRMGRYYVLYNKKYITIKDYLAGKNPVFFSDNLIKQVAKNMVLMQKVFLKLNIYIPKMPFAEELFHDYNFKKKVKNRTYLKFYRQWMSTYDSLNHNKLRKCLSHGDLIEINMIVNDDKLMGFIDFEEMGKDYLISDVCSFMSMALMETNHKTFKHSYKVFLHYYQKHLRLNDEEKKALYYFIGLDLLRCEDLRQRSKDLSKISLEEFLDFFN
jgi:Ser/Thr protein kinase RdoA (MazF antagonist)